MWPKLHTVYGKSFEEGNVRGFRSFLAIRESFPAICFYVNGGSYGTMCKMRSFSSEWRFCLVTAKVFRLESFAVYGISLQSTYGSKQSHKIYVLHYHGDFTVQSNNYHTSN